MARELPVGVRRTQYGFEARARIGSRRTKTVLERSKHFPKNALIREMRAWQDAEVVRLRAELAARVGPAAIRGTLAADIDRYLKLVASMPSADSRARDLEAWRERFGDVPRSALTAERIRAQLHDWRLNGPRYKVTRGATKGAPARIVRVPGGLSASACNHRRTALLHLFTVLDGKRAANPVREVPRFAEPAPEPRARDLADLVKVIALVSSNKQRARLQVLLWTGMRGHSELSRMKPEYLDLAAKVCHVPTSKSARTFRVVTLNDHGVKGWRAFIAADAWGEFDRTSLRTAFIRAAKRAGITRIRLYDLRHSQASALLRAGADLADVQQFLGHTTPRMTRRYAPFQSAKLAGATDRIGAELDSTAGNSNGDETVNTEPSEVRH